MDNKVWRRGWRSYISMEWGENVCPLWEFSPSVPHDCVEADWVAMMSGRAPEIQNNGGLSQYWTIVRPNKLNLTPVHLTQFFIEVWITTSSNVQNRKANVSLSLELLIRDADLASNTQRHFPKYFIREFLSMKDNSMWSWWMKDSHIF